MEYFEAGWAIPSEAVYFQVADAYPVLTQAQVVELGLIRDAAREAGLQGEAEDAIKRIALGNMRLVGKLAYLARSALHPLERIQHGYDGLLKAASGFAWELGSRFSTYASRCIKRKMWEAARRVGAGDDIKLYRLDEWSALLKAQARLFPKLGREPSEAELADELGFTTKHVRKLFLLFQRPKEYQDELGDQQAGSLWGRGRNLHELTPEEVVLLAERIHWGQRVLDEADDRARRYIRRRYGFDHPDLVEETSTQIGQSEGLTDERVNQVMKDERRGVLAPFLDRHGVEVDILDERTFPWQAGRPATRTFKRP